MVGDFWVYTDSCWLPVFRVRKESEKKKPPEIAGGDFLYGGLWLAQLGKATPYRTNPTPHRTAQVKSIVSYFLQRSNGF